MKKKENLPGEEGPGFAGLLEVTWQKSILGNLLVLFCPREIFLFFLGVKMQVQCFPL